MAGSGLNRAAELRGDTAAMRAALSDTNTRILPMWQGRFLFVAEGSVPDPALGQGLASVPPDHSVLNGAEEPAVFLGLSNGHHVFAQDVCGWVPDDTLDPQARLAQDRIYDATLPAGSFFADLRGQMMALDARAAELAATARGVLGWHRSHRFCAACGAPSIPEDMGWRRGCAACGTSHFPRTDPCVIMMVVRDNAALLGRSPHWPEQMFSCLAGFMEPGETVEAAVRREVFEETGIRVGEVRPVASQPWPFPASLMLGCVAVAQSDEITVDPVEIEEALWVSRERLLRIFAGRDDVIRTPRAGAIAGWLMREWLADTLIPRQKF
ncbi:NAD(+) diphosphatase [Rhodobacteraceae bacterium]|nr:NAD(+) diphosphatase [Paracoccaceae bacterium]